MSAAAAGLCIQVAPDAVSAVQDGFCGNVRAAMRHGVRTSRVEVTAGGRADRTGRFALQTCMRCSGIGVRYRQRCQQSFGVRVQGGIVYHVTRGCFYDASQIHDRNTMAEVSDNAEIVRYEQHGKSQ